MRLVAGQPIARLDQAIFEARVNEASAALNVATASAEVQQAAVTRATIAISSAHTAQKLAEAQCQSAKAKRTEAGLELKRKLALSTTGIASKRELTQAQTLKETADADVKAALEQIHLKEEAVTIAEAELQMAGAELHNAQATIDQRRAALDQAKLDLERTLLRAPISGVILSATSIRVKQSPSLWRPRHSSKSRTTSRKWKFMRGSTKPTSAN